MSPPLEKVFGFVAGQPPTARWEITLSKDALLGWSGGLGDRYLGQAAGTAADAAMRTVSHDPSLLPRRPLGHNCARTAPEIDRTPFRGGFVGHPWAAQYHDVFHASKTHLPVWCGAWLLLGRPPKPPLTPTSVVARPRPPPDPSQFAPRRT